MKRNRLLFLIIIGIILSGCASKPATIETGRLRKTTFALVSSAENSSINYNQQYKYIEDIGDGRGYTAGVIGFTSGTGDLLDVVRTYVALRPHGNRLRPYLPALEKVTGTSSHRGLGPQFVHAWRQSAQDRRLIQAQNTIVQKEYLGPAVRTAMKDGLSPLGQYIYYDALVVHGPGKDPDSFQGIRRAALRHAQPPSDGGNEAHYLLAFLRARTPIMKQEAAHRDLSRLQTQQRLIQEHNYQLQLPLTWKMYGQSFHLTAVKLSKMS